jgi:hypothetical protein
MGVWGSLRFRNDLRRNRPSGKDNRGNKEHRAPKTGTV